MKNFQTKIGKNTVFTVHNNTATFVQHSSEGMQKLRLPVTSLLQAVSNMVLEDLGSVDSKDEAIFLATPYISRALQHGASVMSGIPEGGCNNCLEVIRQHPQAGQVDVITRRDLERGTVDIIFTARRL